MLTNLGHTSGEKSPSFDAQVGLCGRANVIFEKETRKAFTRIHELRTRGLHRLEKRLNRAEISTLAVEIYLFFQYFDDFVEAQEVKTITLTGKRYRRLKYGNEELKYTYGREKADPIRRKEWEELTKRPCHDCHAVKGQYHCDGCDMERCPRCFTQLLSCGCSRGG